MKATISMNNERVLDTETIKIEKRDKGFIDKQFHNNNYLRRQLIKMSRGIQLYNLKNEQVLKLYKQLQHTKKYRTIKKIQNRIIKELINRGKHSYSNSKHNKLYTTIKANTWYHSLKDTGIDIKDSTGQVKPIQDILDELSQKWKSTL